MTRDTDDPRSPGERHGRRPSGRKRLVSWLGTTLGIAIFAFLFWRYDPATIFRPLLASQGWLLLAVIGVQASIGLLNAVTPALLLGPPVGGGISRWLEIRTFLAVQPLALATPGRLSDFGALLFLKRHHRTGAVASSILLDKIITLFLLLLLAPAALHLVWPDPPTLVMYGAILLSLLAVGSLPLVLVRPRLRRLVNRYLLRRWPGALEGFGDHVEHLLSGSKARLTANAALTLLKILLAGVAIHLLARNVGLELGVATAAWMSVLVQLVTSVPLAPQGLGIAEGSLVLLFAANGFPEALAVAVGVLGRVLSLPVQAGIYMATTVPLVADRWT